MLDSAKVAHCSTGDYLDDAKHGSGKFTWPNGNASLLKSLQQFVSMIAVASCHLRFMRADGRTESDMERRPSSRALLSVATAFARLA